MLLGPQHLEFPSPSGRVGQDVLTPCFSPQLMPTFIDFIVT